MPLQKRLMVSWATFKGTKGKIKQFGSALLLLQYGEFEER